MGANHGSGALPFFMAWQSLRSSASLRKSRRRLPCRTLSIVIPTRNEEAFIERCIRSVSRSPHVREIIVVDAASGDKTRFLARRAGARVLVHDRPIECGGGRGGQIKAGIDASSGDVIAVVHADTLLSEYDINRMMEILNRRTDIIGGAVGCRFDSHGFRYRLLELANDFRAAFLGISFGDQVQFFRRNPVVSHDLFPDIPIMEDVELSIRLRRLGRSIYLFGNAKASPRRWNRIGYKNAVWVIINVITYLVRRMNKQSDLFRVYRQYYESHKDC